MINGTDPKSWGMDQIETLDHGDNAESVIDAVASILALGILRLHRATSANTRNMPESAVFPADSSHIGLELPDLSRPDEPGGYRYYTCLNAQKRGWDTCPTKSVSAGEIEQLVVEQLRAIGREPALVTATVRAARKHVQAEINRLEGEHATLGRDLKRTHGEIRGVVAEATTGNGSTSARLADLNERVRVAEDRRSVVAMEVEALRGRLIDEREVAEALAAFDPVWETLTPKEQARIVRLLVERIDYDGARGKVAITFHATGLKSLGGEAAKRAQAAQEVAA